MRIAAYVYPGWHPVPERDANFHPGFTEWELVAACRPRFEGHATLGRIDDVLAAFYRERPARLALSLGCHFVAWLLGAVEAWLMLWFLDMPVSLVTATIIEAFGTGIRFATFVVPGSIGVLEGEVNGQLNGTAHGGADAAKVAVEAQSGQVDRPDSRL